MCAEGWGETVTAPTSFGQKRQWHYYRMRPEGERWRDNILNHLPLSSGVGTDSVRLAVDTLAARHEGLRTRYGLDEHGAPVQRIASRAPIPFVCRDISGATDPEAAGRAFAVRLCRHDFRLETEPPIRVGLLIEGRVAYWLVLVVHHIAADWMGMIELRRELCSILADLAAGRPPDRSPAAVQPAAEAARESNGRERRHADASLAYWREAIETAPVTTFPICPRMDGETGSAQWSLDSRQAAEQVTAIARRHGVGEPTVLLTLYAALLWRHLGNRDLMIKLYCSNRYRSRILRLIGTLTQPLPVLFEGLTDDMRLSMLLRRTAATETTVYRHGRYDELAVTELRTIRQYERGVNLTTMPAFNFLSTADGPSVDGPSVDVGGEDGEARWTAEAGEAGDPFELRVRRDGPALSVTFRYDRSVISSDKVADLLRAYLRLASIAAEADDLRIADLLETAEVAAEPRGAGWLLRDGCWFSTTVSSDVLTRHGAVRAAFVTDEGAGRVRAHVRAAPGTVTAVELRAHHAAALGATPATVVPDEFVIHTATDAEAPSRWWLRKDDIAEIGDGRDVPRTATTAPAAPTADPAVRALYEAFTSTHPDLERRWGAVPYLPAGGRMAAVEMMLRELERSGHPGLDYADLVSLRPVPELAALLRSQFER